ncbi:twin-arginine translocase TatA/TatE family subunit [Aliifodinibius sp. S!AR15-10]|uniref:twin-arginine translocase TatA/TatE family subunit n=1 Tax=Aliifodinibius sp. S!AR15-10 TaxID=2950437 RepID=UPI0028664367|nr:twin-arginine translocase TatA/TatE family subunit [Aliifodinibius sp. S!AR15-10]MDR8392581.1 twin-arginine translocase TatA/TatE family subunit [Aliifodinibius sp. S!AR15-10]
MLGGLGGTEILVILLVILLFFGAKKIPELARGIGQGINEFRKASDQIKKEIEEGEKESFDSQTQPQEKNQGQPQKQTEN